LSDTDRLEALRRVWPTLPGDSQAERLASLNALDVHSQPSDVSMGEIEAYLAMRGITTTIEDWLADGRDRAWADAHGDQRGTWIAARELMRLLNSRHVEELPTSQPLMSELLGNMLDALVAEGSLITRAEADGLLDLVAPRIPWWQSAGFNGPVTADDLTAAGLT
jgi:hypothetical protein